MAGNMQLDGSERSKKSLRGFGKKPTPRKQVGNEFWNFGQESAPGFDPMGWLINNSDRRSGEGAVGSGAPRGIGAFTKPQPQQEPQQRQLTFADYLAMANQMGLGGDGTDYSALERQLRANASEGDAKLKAMYGQLRSSIDADEAGIAQNYDRGRSGIEGAARQAAAETNSGYDAARAAQTQQMKALGIEQAAAVLAGQGGAAASDQAAANANIAQNKQAGVTQNRANRSAAVNYNTGIGNAAGLEGQVQRAALQQQLANKLAELQTAQSESQAGGQKDVFSAALQLYGMDQEAAGGAAAAQQQDFENQLSTWRSSREASRPFSSSSRGRVRGMLTLSRWRRQRGLTPTTPTR
jgi:hypothetical protein